MKFSQKKRWRGYISIQVSLRTLGLKPNSFWLTMLGIELLSTADQVLSNPMPTKFSHDFWIEVEIWPKEKLEGIPRSKTSILEVWENYWYFWIDIALNFGENCWIRNSVKSWILVWTLVQFFSKFFHRNWKYAKIKVGAISKVYIFP